MFIKIGVVAEAGKKAEPVKEYAFNGGIVTIEKALKLADIKTAGLNQENLRVVRGTETLTATLDIELRDGDKLTVIPKIKGA